MMKKTVSLACLLAPASLALAAPPTSGAYVTDAQQEYVSDQVTEAISNANSILCYLANTRADAMVNQGRYVAFIDEARCDAGDRASASGSSNTSAAGATRYTRMSLTATRATNSSPQLVKGHVELGGDGPPVEAYVHVNASAAPSDSLPNGIMSMDYAGVWSGQKLMRGRITTSASGLSFAESANEGGAQRTIRLYVSGNELTGKGTIDTGSQAILFGYNQTHFCRRLVGSSEYCFKRSKADAASSVWRYGVYDNVTGGRFDLSDPGFPIKTASGEYGFASYWGVWLPTEAQDGQAVSSSDGSQVYTIRKGGGKLVRYTRVSKTLDQIAKVPFTTYATVAGNAGQYEMHWSSEGLFKVTGQVDCSGGNGCFTTQLSASLTAAQLSAATGSWGVSGWSQALGGQLRISPSVLSDASPGAQTVHYSRSQTVQPSDTSVPATLHCVSDCPTRQLVQNLSANSAPFTSGTLNKFGGTLAADLVTYTWDAAAYALKDPALSALSSDDLPTNLPPQYQWGVSSGFLVPSSAIGAGRALDCDGANGQGQTYCSGHAFDLPEYYRFEIGHNAWNRAVFLRRTNGSYVSFSAPKIAAFSVPLDSSLYGSFAGADMSLQFMGFGQLHGIPGRCYSIATNQEVSCGPNTRYVAAFSIPTGADGFVTIDGATKWVKWLDRELRFRQDAGVTSAGLGITMGSANDTSLPAPMALTGADASDPSNSANADVYPGAYAASLFEKSPSVIHGLVQP